MKRYIVVFFLIIAAAAIAQEGTTSPYSFYGLGTLKFKGTVENRSMAGISMFSDSIHLNIQNPAGIAELGLINYSISASHKYNTIKTNAESQKTSTTSLDYLAMGIPMGKFAASFGLIPYTAVGYKLISEGATSTTTYTGSGGLNKAFVALAYKVTDNIHVGFDANYNFGNIENISFSSEDDIQYATREFNKSDLLGFSFTVGAIYKRKVFNNLELTSAVSFTPETNFTSDNQRTVGTYLVTDSGAQAPIDERTIIVPKNEFKNPSQITVGAGIGKPKYWGVGAEYSNFKTSNFSRGLARVKGVFFTNASKYKIGGFYIPNYNSIGNYIKTVVYRGGFRYEETGLNINGQDINEFGISFGVGLPVGKLFSNINLGFEVGSRGTKNGGLVQENFFNTILGFSLNDRWFEKRYYD